EIRTDRVEAVLGDVLVEDDEVVVDRHEGHRDRHGGLLVDRGAGRGIHVLDLENTARLLRKAIPCSDGHCCQTRERNTSLRDFHCFLPPTRLGYTLPPLRTRIADRRNCTGLTGPFALRIVTSMQAKTDTRFKWTPSPVLPEAPVSFAGVGYDEMVERARRLAPGIAQRQPASTLHHLV